MRGVQSFGSLRLVIIVNSPFQAKFSGSYTVVPHLLDLNYIIATPKSRKATKLGHVNLLKPFSTRHPKGEQQSRLCSVDASAFTFSAILTFSPGLSVEEGLTAEVVVRGWLFSDVPSHMHHIEHDKDVADAAPIKLPFEFSTLIRLKFCTFIRFH